MRQQSFNEMLVKALQDETIQYAIRELVNVQKIDTFTESKQKIEQLFERVEREMAERAVMLKELQASQEPVQAEESIDAQLLQQQLAEVSAQYEHMQREHRQQIEQLEHEKQAMANALRNVEREKAQQTLKLQQVQQELSAKQQQLNALQTQHQQLTVQMQQLLNQTAELNSLKQQFAGVREAYRLYNELTPATKQRLAGIVKGASIETFLYCGVQYENIEPLWDAIKREIMEGRTEELDALNAIFSFFFDAHNALYTEPLFKREEVVIGNLLDEDVHMRVANSRVSGPIQRVYFAGYHNVKTLKRVKKSIVEV